MSDTLDGLPSDAASPSLCRHLRTKRYYYGSPDQVLDATDQSTTAQFWCLRTMRPIGPDERPVSATSCRPGRECCVVVEG